MESLEIMPVRIKIASIVRKAILSGEFTAGQELSLTSLSSELGVSRTPVREAFQMLESEGLLELRMNKGAMVKPIDRDFIADHFGMRMLLEGESAARAVKNGMRAEKLEQLQASVSAEQNLAADKYITYNQTFHIMLWKAANSQKLYSFCEILWNGPSFSRFVSDEEHRKKSIEEHGRIISYIAAENAEGARKEMEAHIERSMYNMLNVFPKK